MLQAFERVSVVQRLGQVRVPIGAIRKVRAEVRSDAVDLGPSLIFSRPAFV